MQKYTEIYFHVFPKPLMVHEKIDWVVVIAFIQAHISP